MENQQRVKTLIESKLPGSQVELSDMTGTDDHLEITVFSDEFIGKTILQQHRTVMDILREELRDKVHAVKIKTKTLEDLK